MRELGSCEGGISGEHLIRESIIRLLAGDGEFTVGGLPWLPEGTSKAIGPKSLIAKCLCRRHNSRLHRIDDAALAFFTAQPVSPLTMRIVLAPSVKAPYEKSTDRLAD
jgi:hypothetical protein